MAESKKECSQILTRFIHDSSKVNLHVPTVLKSKYLHDDDLVECSDPFCLISRRPHEEEESRSRSQEMREEACFLPGKYEKAQLWYPAPLRMKRTARPSLEAREAIGTTTECVHPRSRSRPINQSNLEEERQVQQELFTATWNDVVNPHYFNEAADAPTTEFSEEYLILEARRKQFKESNKESIDGIDAPGVCDPKSLQPLPYSQRAFDSIVQDFANKQRQGEGSASRNDIHEHKKARKRAKIVNQEEASLDGNEKADAPENASRVEEQRRLEQMVGKRVILHRLVQNSDLNGCIGMVTRVDRKERLKIKIDGRSKSISVKPFHVRLSDADGEGTGTSAETNAEVETCDAANDELREQRDRDVACAEKGAHSTDGTTQSSAEDDADFIARYLAFRQFVEFLSSTACKTARTQPRKLVIRRSSPIQGVLEAFATHTKMHTWQHTRVTFVDSNGVAEEGVDQGGLTSEMYTLFFRELTTRKPNPIFEGTSQSAGLLPRPDACPQTLRGVGRVLRKCALDDRPVGLGLSSFLFEYLADTHERSVFARALTALSALSSYDPDLAKRWTKLLEHPIEGLTQSDFDGGDSHVQLAATASEFERAVLAGCRHRLLESRRASLEEMRLGFVEHVDLSIQLAAFTPSQRARLLRGKVEVGPKELIACFDLPPSLRFAYAPKGVLSSAPRFLKEAIEGELTANERLDLLEWATALRALPTNGLHAQIKLKPYHDATDADLPMVHTCTYEVHLPPYSSRDILIEKLRLAIAHRHDGFHTS